MDKTKIIILALVVIWTTLHMVRSAEQVTVDGALGDGRKFVLNSLDYMGLLGKIMDSSRCCESCQARYPDTSMIEFEEVYKICYCSKREPGRQPRTKGSPGVFSDVCVTVDGALGDGRAFVWSSLDYMGDLDNVVDSSRCCESCQARYPGTSIIEFHEATKFCYCSKKEPGRQPRTKGNPHYFSDVCVTVDGALGDGRELDWNSLDYMGHLDNVVDWSRCCESCQASYPDTSIIEFQEASKFCFCSKRKPGRQPRTKWNPHYISDVCVTVDGALGDGREFDLNSLDHMGFLGKIVDSSRCCESCQARYPDTSMILFEEAYKICYCAKREPGRQPRTKGNPGAFSDVCGVKTK